MNQSNEAITIIVAGRDRFSLTESCIETLIANTPQPYHLIVVLGGAPKEFESRLRERYGTTVTLVFEPQFPELLRVAQHRLKARYDPTFGLYG